MSKFSFISNALKRFNSQFNNPYKKIISLPTLLKLKFGVTQKEQTCVVFGKKMHFINPRDTLHCISEILVAEVYKQKLDNRTQPYILDCGANIGVSVIYLKKLFPAAIIEAFEPDETNFGLLEKNVISFGYQNEVTLHKAAVWNANTQLQFLSNGIGSKIEMHSNESETIEVKALRLKDFLNKKVDFLKMDIEGAEYDVLKDIIPSLGNVNNFFIEYHGKFEQNNELLEILLEIKKAGFKFYIKEALDVYQKPLSKEKSHVTPYDLQLNIFCFR